MNQAATQKQTRTITQTRPRRTPRYAVVLHNDERHTFQYVMEVLCSVCGHNVEDAFQLTLEAHTMGEALVWRGPLEVAELKRDQIRGFGPDCHAQKPVKFPLGVSLRPLPED